MKTMKLGQYLTTLGLLVLVFGCSANRSQSVSANDPAVVLFTGAAEYIKELSQQGKLPGFSKGEHGLIRSHRMTGGEKVVYPVEMTLQVEKAAQGNQIYWYVLRKHSEDSHWEVANAWTTDFQGQNRVELSRINE
jgi:hypothetical protein